MKKKIFVIFVMMLLIATVLPAVGSINKPVRKDNKILAQKTKSDYIPGSLHWNQASDASCLWTRPDVHT